MVKKKEYKFGDVISRNNKKYFVTDVLKTKIKAVKILEHGTRYESLTRSKVSFWKDKKKKLI